MDFIFSPTFLAHLFNRYYVKDDALYRQASPGSFQTQLTYGMHPLRLAPSVRATLDIDPDNFPHPFHMSLVAYLLHHVKPIAKPKTSLHLYMPEHFAPYRMPRHSRVIHVSYNRADFSKDNLRLVLLAPPNPKSPAAQRLQRNKTQATTKLKHLT